MNFRLSYQNIILIGCLVVVICTQVFVAVILQHSLRDELLSQSKAAMEKQLALAGALVRATWPKNEDTPSLDEIARRIGTFLNLRVTLIAKDGKVLSDSEVPPDKLKDLDSHATRPEVKAALSGREVTSIRNSKSLGTNLLYLASAIEVPGRGRLVVRLAVPLSNVDRALDRLRRIIIGVLLLGIVLSIGLAYMVARGIFKPVRELTQTAAAISKGDMSRRLRRYPKNEVGDLGKAFDSMADNVQEKIEDVTQTRDRLEAVLWGMSEGVLVTDGKGRILLANQALLELLGLSQNPQGRLISEIVRNADLLEAVRLARGGQRQVWRQIRILKPAPRHMDLRVVRLAEAGDQAGAGCVAVLHDITELKRTEEIRKDFVANVSHELRTPLTAIRGSAETLLGGALESPPDAIRFLKMISRHAERLELLSEDLLALSRIESGQIASNREDIEAEELADNLINTMAGPAADRDIQLKETPPPKGLVIRANRRDIEQALLNLLHNAIKYTEPGGEVTLSFAVKKNDVRISVSDTGVGIPPEHQERIFERFYRVDKNRSRQMGGTGLGLAIVKHLANSLGGKVELESEPGVGSVFTLVVPVN